MIEVTFSSSTHETSAFGLTQWDKGQKLKIIWEDIPESFQVHFSSRDAHEAIVVEASGQSGVAVVEIPDELLKNSADIFAWMYLTENDTVGESVKRAVLYVRPRAKPHSVIEDLEPSQQELLEDILRDINENIRHIMENGTDAEYIPDYVKVEAENLIKKIGDRQNKDSIVFMVSSDAHLKTGDYRSEAAIRHMSQAMRLVAERCPISFAAYLGDMTSGGDSKDISEAKTEIANVNAALFPSFCHVPSLRCAGSEDSLYKAYFRNGGYIGSEELLNLIGKWNKGAVAPKTDEIRGYCYRDLEDEKLRVICLNTSDTYGTDLRPDSETAVMSAKQLQWLCETLDLSSKADSGSWGIIILGHHPLNMTEKFPVAVRILEAYASGESVSIMTAASETVTYDFSGKNSAVILGQFHGHLHNYRVNFVTKNKIPLIGIPNASFYDSNFYADPSYTYAENTNYAEAVTYNKSVGTANDTAFCVVVMDKISGEIHVLHYGAGVDRTVLSGSVTEENPDDAGDNPGDNGGNDNDDDNNSSGGNTGGSGGNDDDEGDSGNNDTYTNLVSSATNQNMQAYNNGNGYFDDYRLTSSSNLSQIAGYTHTGFIRANVNDVIRVAGGIFDGTTGNYIFVYDSSFKMIWFALLSGGRDSDSGIAYTDSGILVFSPARVQTGDLSGMAYFRVSTVARGSDLIVTANEKIDDSTILDDMAPPVTSYTNIVKYATDENENLYGTNGYKNGYKLSEDGQAVPGAGYVVTGYLVADMQAVIRVKGTDNNGTDGCRLCLYDSNYNLIRAIPLNGNTNGNYGLRWSGGIMTFTPANASEDYSAMAYFRVSGIGSGSYLTVTYCEEII